MTSSHCPYSPDDQVEFAYGEMEATRAEEFLAHLEGCPACQAAVSGLKRAELLCRTVRQSPVPEAKWTSTFEPRRAPTPLWKRPLIWAPALAAGALLSRWWRRRESNPRPKAVPRGPLHA